MDKHVCITGCSRGLGAALAHWFLDAGWGVSGFGRSRNAIDALQQRAGNQPCRFQALDITDEPAVAAFAQTVCDALGPPDLLVNNAGVINPNAPLWEVTADAFDRVIDVNVKGVAHVIRHFTPRLIARGSGVVVNVSSGWGRSTSPEVAPYCASKWAIEGLSQAMAQELPEGVAVTAMNPGVIDTEMLRSCFGEQASAYHDATEWAKRAGPFLAQLDASVNGKAITAP